MWAMQAVGAKVVLEMRHALVSAINADGGWGYYPAKASRLEPTCWALLALQNSNSSDSIDLRAADGFFQQSQRSDGLLLEAAVRDEDRPNLAFNGLAAVLFASQKTSAPEGMLERVTAGIIDHRGIKLPQSPLSPQDNSLQAWSWIDSTFSWVEPTGWCLLALKKSAGGRADAQQRIDVAERMLRDRCCTAGGWNSGTAMVLGQGLNPYVPTTALGLMALHNLPQDPVVVRSLAALNQLRLTERSAMALSLGLIALALFGADTGDVEAALVEQWHRTSFLGNTHLTSMALYSLTQKDHGTSAFRI
jgi:hypothetical protein